jgi:hypothetical protein
MEISFMCDIVTHFHGIVNATVFSSGRGEASDNQDMSVFACCSASTFKTLSRAAAKSAAAKFRQLGVGSVHPRWTVRAQICERCPMRVIARGISYCGDPFLERIHRDPQVHGCGCPTRAKAQSRSEHCPLDPSHAPAITIQGKCTCKWCAGGDE